MMQEPSSDAAAANAPGPGSREPPIYVPRSLLLQWHITERCNLRCAHCYQESYSGAELPLEDLLSLLAQFEDLLAEWRALAGTPYRRAHITVTGGEPFVRADCLDFLAVLATRRSAFTFAILTNGHFIDTGLARRLSSLGPAFVQVSLEGTAATHDAIRGPGSFKRVVSAITHLRKQGIRTFISFTAHQGNYREFPAVARLGCQLQVARVWADRMIPAGQGPGWREQVLTPPQTQEFFGLMRQARAEARERWFSRTEIAMHRALQFTMTRGEPYHCTAGDSLIALQPNGDLYPCRRLPLSVGNLLQTSLRELYYGSDLFQRLRACQQISDGCQRCLYASLCRGGLKCLSQAVTGGPFNADPGCWIADRRPVESGK